MSAKPQVLSVYIGRFQPLHKGHEEVIRRAMSNSDHLLVIIGSSNIAATVKNPFTGGQRRTMISDFLWKSEDIPNKNYTLVNVGDYPYSDSTWMGEIHRLVSLQCDDILRKTGQLPTVKLVGSDRDDSTWYLSAFPRWQLDLIDPFPEGGNMNATELRHRLFARELAVEEVNETIFPELSEHVRAYIRGWMATSTSYANLVAEEKCIRDYKERWASAPYAPTFITADAVVIQSGHLLVVERGQRPGKGLYALPGGFVNQKERVRDAAVRELIEETGLKVPEAVLKGSIRATETFDHPDRSLRGRTVTYASLIMLDDTKPLPRVKGQNVPAHESGGKEIVETAKAFWMPLSQARRQPELWFEDHWHIINWASAQI